jgi:hypothetical protein
MRIPRTAGGEARLSHLAHPMLRAAAFRCLTPSLRGCGCVGTNG